MFLARIRLSFRCFCPGADGIGAGAGKGLLGLGQKGGWSGIGVGGGGCFGVGATGI